MKSLQSKNHKESAIKWNLRNKDYQKNYRIKNKEKISKQKKLKYLENRDFLTKIRRIKWNKMTPEQKSMHNIKHTLGLYNISLDEYNKLLKKQNKICAICKKIGDDKRLPLDHDHKTGKIREFLCTNCNLALGHTNDSIETLQNMIIYLKKHT